MWRTEGIWAAGGCVVVATVAWLSGVASQLDLRFYDLATRTVLSADATDIAIVAIDAESTAALGPHPWHRDVHARMMERLATVGAKAVVYTPILAEQPADPGLVLVRRIRDALTGLGDPSPLAQEVGRLAVAAEIALDGEQRLARAIVQSGNVVLSSSYSPAGAGSRPVPAFMRRHAVPGAHNSAPSAMGTVQYPAAALGSVSAGVGHLQAVRDADGKVRRIDGLVNDQGIGVASLALLAARQALPSRPEVPSLWTDGHRLKLGNQELPADPALRLRPRLYSGPAGTAAFPTHSFATVLTDPAGASTLKGKLVLVGATGEFAGQPWHSLDGRAVYPVDMLAHAITSVQQGGLVQRPTGALAAGWAGLVAALLFAALVLPRLSIRSALMSGTVLAVVAGGAQWFLLRYPGLWVPLLPGALLVIVGAVTVLLYRQGMARRGAGASGSAHTAESDRMMGLALQGQGQLDMAFERLRKVPMSDALLDNLYHLGQDYERKHNLTRAKAVYGLILRHDKDYRDVRGRYKRLRAQLQRADAASDADTASIPPSQPPSGSPSLSAGGADARIPLLGRYRIEREIGKGAMGAVYLGRDPKIGRVVALKTMALGNEFEGAALIDARARFFREAETAGRLQHPNIVTIFDAGEDQGLAYIAMEFLKGSDLTGACSDGTLLPTQTVLSIAARVADALDYAHAHHVVHRDIKPANIMYDAGTDTVKVTDFGIARITDASRTRTGLVLGTPSFMSPEQLAGKKIDGRSDLYALGVTMFQLLAGRLPLRGASMNELMHMIASVDAPDIRDVRPDLPASVAQVVAKALRKHPEARYQTGRQFATDIRLAMSAPDLTSGGPGNRSVVYDAGREATANEMAAYQKTVPDAPAVRGGVSSPISSAPRRSPPHP